MRARRMRKSVIIASLMVIVVALSGCVDSATIEITTNKLQVVYLEWFTVKVVIETQAWDNAYIVSAKMVVSKPPQEDTHDLMDDLETTTIPPSIPTEVYFQPWRFLETALPGTWTLTVMFTIEDDLGVTLKLVDDTKIKLWFD